MAGGPVILDDLTPEVIGYTHQQYRRAVCQTVDEFGVMSVTTRATGGETRRWVICEGIQSDGLKSDRLDEFWLYVTNGAQAGQVRRVLEGTYSGNVGAFMVDRPFTSALAVGTEVELSKSLPAVKYGTVPGVLECLNEALETLPVVHKGVEIEATADTLRQYLSDLPYPVKAVHAVYGPVAEPDERLRRVTGWTFEQNAETPFLQMCSEYEDGEILRLDLTRSAMSRISVDGEWGDSTVGLVNETDRALYDVQTVVRVARPIVLDRMALLRSRGSAERNEIKGEAQGERREAAIRRWFGGFKRDGAQRVGAR